MNIMVVMTTTHMMIMIFEKGNKTMKHYVIARDYTEYTYGTASIDISESELEFIKERLDVEYPGVVDKYTDEQLFECDEFWSVLEEYYDVEYEDTGWDSFEYPDLPYLSESYENN